MISPAHDGLKEATYVEHTTGNVAEVSYAEYSHDEKIVSQASAEKPTKKRRLMIRWIAIAAVTLIIIGAIAGGVGAHFARQKWQKSESEASGSDSGCESFTLKVVR